MAIIWIVELANLENLKKENNKLRVVHELQHHKNACIATPKKTLIFSSQRKVYAENQIQ